MNVTKFWCKRTHRPNKTDDTCIFFLNILHILGPILNKNLWFSHNFNDKNVFSFHSKYSYRGQRCLAVHLPLNISIDDEDDDEDIDAIITDDSGGDSEGESHRVIQFVSAADY